MEGLIEVACPCGRKLRVRLERAGRAVRCPQCRAAIAVPSETGPNRRRPAPHPAAQRHLKHEGHVRAVSLWTIVEGAAILACGMMVSGLVAAIDAKGGSSLLGTDRLPLALVIFLMMGYGAATLVVGFFLWRYHGWARWAFVALTLLGMIMRIASVAGKSKAYDSAIALVWSAACLWVVLAGPATRIFTRSYRDLAARTRGLVKIPMVRSPFFWIPVCVLTIAMLFFIVGAAAVAR